MAVADAPSLTPSPPEECVHPAPVHGVMANEFAHYSGAQGPEGARRTVTYYGPVLGGLPIQAWHCTACGLLRLAHPDGRREERRLFPGPQPGLLLEAGTASPDTEHYGMQARVSGLTASPDLLDQIALREDAGRTSRARPPRTRPALGAATWTVVALLSLLSVGLLVAGVLAVYDWTTPEIMGPLVATGAAVFGGTLVVFVVGAVWRHLGPPVPLSPSAAVSGRGGVQLDTTSATVVALLGLTTAGLLVAGVLAVYDWTTPGLMGPLLIAALACAALGVVLLIANGIARHRRRD